MWRGVEGRRQRRGTRVLYDEAAAQKKRTRRAGSASLHHLHHLPSQGQATKSIRFEFVDESERGYLWKLLVAVDAR